jgi:hypothetical protein
MKKEENEVKILREKQKIPWRKEKFFLFGVGHGLQILILNTPPPTKAQGL